MDVPHIFGAEINMLHERNVRLAETLQGKPSAENADIAIDGHIKSMVMMAEFIKKHVVNEPWPTRGIFTQDHQTS